MKKFIVWLLVITSLAALLLRFSDQWAESLFGFKSTGGISVLSQPADAAVFINNHEVGKTPFEDKNLEEGEYTVKLEKNGASWQGKINLISGTVAVVNRDLASDQASSAGEILTLDKGKGLTIISNPTASDIEIDGKPYGKTPLNIDILNGDHTILLSHTNYFKRSIRAALPANFNLTIAADLALSEADLTAIPTPTIAQQQHQLIVKNTPTGFLRVRDKPNLSGKEIGRVKPGDTLILLEEIGDWDKIRLTDGTEGFISSAYVEKKNSNS